MQDDTMSTFTDMYGREVNVEIDIDGKDIYTLEGIILEFPTGTPESQALSSINGMAPSWYVPPEPEQQPTLEEMIDAAIRKRLQPEQSEEVANERPTQEPAAKDAGYPPYRRRR
jgi:hypothetical protein